MKRKFTAKKMFGRLASVLALVLAITLLAFNSGTAQAAEFKGLMISPASNRIDLKNSEVYTGEMNVQNSSEGDMHIKMSVGSYIIQDNNYNAPNYSGSSKYSEMQDWIKLDNEEFDLAAGESKIVKYTVVTPANPPAGMQYATIFAENIPDEVEGSGITATSRVGLVLSAKMVDGETVDKSTIQNEKIASYQPTSPLKASFDIQNEGNIGVDVTYSMKITNAINGSEVYSSDSQSSSVYPETTRSYSVTWDGVGIGFYNVELNIQMNGQQHTVKKMVCTIPVWIILLLLIAIISLVAYAVINHRMAQEAKSGKKSGKAIKKSKK